MIISDDTLREGLQTPDIAFTKEEKLKLASMISAAGVKRALVSYPPAHLSEQEVTEKIVRAKYFEEVFGLGRTLKADVDTIYSTDANIALHLPFEIEEFDEIEDVIRYASKLDRIVEVALVDVVKYSGDDLTKIMRKLVESGADVIQIPDTMGTASPRLMKQAVERLKKKFDVKIEIHCHNDLGGSVANSISAIEAGADILDTTVLGLGERNGIADLASINSLLKREGYRTGIKESNLKELYGYLTDLVLNKIGNEHFLNNRPVFGKNVNISTAGTHAAFSNVFESSDFSVNVYTGRAMINQILKSEGFTLTEKALDGLVRKVKDRSVETGKAVTKKEVIEMMGGYE
jgi:2-isopropylmalate synthase